MDIQLIKDIQAKASSLNKTLLLPESHDERVLKAAQIISKEKLARVITLGNEEKIKADAEKLGLDLSGVEIIDPEKAANFEDYANKYFEARKHKGMTIEKARETMKRDLFYGAMMVKEGLVDASVAGSTASTADVMRAGIQIVGVEKGCSIVSSFFLMAFPDRNYAFGDCAVVPNPDAQQLADIAISTAVNFEKLTGEEPKIAMLSFSTKGSAEHELVDKVRQATAIVQEKRPDLNVDGEMQFDAAIVESIGQKKSPGSKVAGKANVLIFPDLQAGNIGYKIAQRWGGAEAIGPMSQGLSKPYFDLSRGCSVEDIVATSAIALLMS